MEREMTIARGLTRIKTIKAQLADITGKINQYSAWNTKKKHLLGDNKGTIEQTHNQAQEQINSWYQQFNDLLQEFIRIKKAIDTTNMETKITVASKEMTIYEALCHRREIANYQREFVKAYGMAITRAQVDIDKYNAQFANAVEEIRKLNLADLICFIDKKKMEDLDKYLNEFVNEVDGELNAVNSITLLKFE